MSPQIEVALYRTLGNLETGLENLTAELARANTLSEARATLTDKRVSSLERWRDKVSGGSVVVLTITGAIWAIFQWVLG